jgi:putative zinc finger/helix-turn-helix YgiT family protein
MKEKNMIFTVCPNCEKECHAQPFHESRPFSLNGETIVIPVNLLRCLECHQEFEDHNDPIDELDVVYREYRRRHNMLQPEEIEMVRKQLKLSHQQFAEILGVSSLEVIGYERGVLQDKEQDLAIKALKRLSFVPQINPHKLTVKKSLLVGFHYMLQQAVKEKKVEQSLIKTDAFLKSAPHSIYKAVSRIYHILVRFLPIMEDSLWPMKKTNN